MFTDINLLHEKIVGLLHYLWYVVVCSVFSELLQASLQICIQSVYFDVRNAIYVAMLNPVIRFQNSEKKEITNDKRDKSTTTWEMQNAKCETNSVEEKCLNCCFKNGAKNDAFLNPWNRVLRDRL